MTRRRVYRDLAAMIGIVGGTLGVGVGVIWVMERMLHHFGGPGIALTAFILMLAVAEAIIRLENRP